MKPVVYLLAATCAVLTVLGSRLVIPAFIVLFRYIEAGFAPDELATATAGTTSPPLNYLLFRPLLKNQRRSLVLPGAESQGSNCSRKWRRSRREDFSTRTPAFR